MLEIVALKFEALCFSCQLDANANCPAALCDLKRNMTMVEFKAISRKSEALLAMQHNTLAYHVSLDSSLCPHKSIL